ncbi:FmdB family zinc ribbon protein [Lacicoccus alkaliphilus]|uniref:Putative regulatory protein, FmdB family n=1 Tax=Lacicoccus alkaliphilus DSM 16010 TaxID=1123231 RepID=A0A1M7CXI3_9BACL|nr:FmdB family zinc ribbon protein [Salinicoccus alkaliphilus]SHL71539.1 putative regulatory protein, FmdB family [Salinicoccus alkaliphilus DSM 16010]
MPKYTFTCTTCGEYDVWKSMSADLANDFCPECGAGTIRKYDGFQVGRMDTKLKKRVEGGMTPKVVKKEALPQSNIKELNANPRPWMV